MTNTEKADKYTAGGTSAAPAVAVSNVCPYKDEGKHGQQPGSNGHIVVTALITMSFGSVLSCLNR